MSIQTDYNFQAPKMRRRLDAGDILWMIGSGLASLAASPVLAIYLLLVN